MSQQTFNAAMRYGGLRNGASYESWPTNAVAYQGCYNGLHYPNVEEAGYIGGTRYGIIQFDGISELCSTKKITALEMTIDFPTAGNNTKKTIKFWKSNYTSVDTSKNPSSYIGASLGDYATTVVAYNKSETITLNETTNSELFNSFVNYFSTSGNDLICIYNGEDTDDLIGKGNESTSTQCYSPNYLQFKTCTLKVTYKEKYTVTYVANGGSGAPAAQAKIEGEDLTLSSTVPTYTGRTFKGWGTSATDTTVDYAAGGTYSTDGNITLYAIWELNEYTISYNRNGYTVASGFPSPSTQTKTYGTALTLSSSKPVLDPTQLTAYTVTLNANGGTCTSSSLTAARTKTNTFTSWNTKADGTGVNYNVGASYTAESNATLYIKADSSTVTNNVDLPTATKTGYKFLGWATSPTAIGGTTGSYTPTGNVTLYAIWEAQGLVYIDNGTTLEPYSIWIDNGTSWDQYMAYVDNGTSWDPCG